MRSAVNKALMKAGEGGEACQRRWESMSVEPVAEKMSSVLGVHWVAALCSSWLSMSSALKAFVEGEWIAKPASIACSHFKLSPIVLIFISSLFFYSSIRFFFGTFASEIVSIPIYKSH